VTRRRACSPARGRARPRQRHCVNTLAGLTSAGLLAQGCGSPFVSRMEAEETLTAADYVARETLAEVEAAVAETKGCTFDCFMTDALWPAARSVPGIMQVIYSCRTCALAAGCAVGVCEPCSLRCHDTHELVEVGLRRTFRCDCPTERCPAPCVSSPRATKAPASVSNRYGQNFEGRFCTCKRTYDASRDVMLQCVACDEWCK